MGYELFSDEEFFRVDLPSPRMDPDTQVKFNKMRGDILRASRERAKPATCCICGKPITALCNSHTIPQYSLREIAEGGKLYSFNYLIGSDLFSNEAGIKEALTFRRICRKCDTDFFKAYETPEVLFNAPTTQIMGQIASKNLLREISKAREELAMYNLMREMQPFGFFDEKTTVREIDLAEYESALKIALSVGRKPTESEQYGLIYHTILPYTTPLAFQQMINPVSDFEGGLVNNCFNPSPKYVIEPMHTCVLPSRGKTVVMLFTSKKAKRYRPFRRQLANRSDDEILKAIVKLIFAYSEDLLLSKRIDKSAIKDPSLKKLARMNTTYLGFGDDSHVARNSSLRQALVDFAIDNMPTPPALLSRKYAISG